MAIMKKLLILLLFIPYFGFSQIKVSALTEATTVGGSDLFLLVQSGTTKKVQFYRFAYNSDSTGNQLHDSLVNYTTRQEMIDSLLDYVTRIEMLDSLGNYTTLDSLDSYLLSTQIRNEIHDSLILYVWDEDSTARVVHDSLVSINSPSLGTDGQIPFMNVAGSDLSYSDGLKWNDTILLVGNSGNYNIGIAPFLDGENYYDINTGQSNTSINVSLISNTTGTNNVAIGDASIISNTTGSYNTSIGSYSMYANITGNNNTSIGYRAGIYSSGNDNIYIGSQSGMQDVGYTGGYDSLLFIDIQASATPLIYGDFANDTVRINGSINITNDVKFSHGFWDDLSTGASLTKVGSSYKPDFDYTNISLLFPKNDSTEIVYFNYQMPHSWEEGSTIYPHVHYIQKAAGDTAVWVIKYRWTDMGETQAANFTRVVTNDNTKYTYSSGNLHQLATFPAISGTGHTASSVLSIMLFRKDNLGTGDVPFKLFDLHYEVDKVGSYNQYP